MNRTASRHDGSVLAAAFLIISNSPAWAARPLITDDARIVDAKSCQIETWRRHNEGSTEYGPYRRAIHSATPRSHWAAHS